MSTFKIILPDSENPNKAQAFGEWEDTPANRKTLSEWSSMVYMETPDETTIKCYNECWYHKPLDWWFNKMNANEHKYGFLYDFLYMGMRYTCPMVALYFCRQFLF